MARPGKSFGLIMRYRIIYVYTCCAYGVAVCIQSQRRGSRKKTYAYKGSCIHSNWQMCSLPIFGFSSMIINSCACVLRSGLKGRTRGEYGLGREFLYKYLLKVGKRENTNISLIWIELVTGVVIWMSSRGNFDFFYI